MSWSWPATTPIEIMFLDLAKSWELNQHVISNYFPALVPGISTLVQQDYVHFNEYWVPITMEYFADEFKCEGFIFGATAWFTLLKPIPAHKLEMKLSSLSYSQKTRLLQAALEKAPVSVKEVLKCSLAKCALDHGDIKASHHYLELVNEDIRGEDPLSDFGAIAKSNKEQMLALLKNPLQRS